LHSLGTTPPFFYSSQRRQEQGRTTRPEVRCGFNSQRERQPAFPPKPPPRSSSKRETSQGGGVRRSKHSPADYPKQPSLHFSAPGTRLVLVRWARHRHLSRRRPAAARDEATPPPSAIRNPEWYMSSSQQHFPWVPPTLGPYLYSGPGPFIQTQPCPQGPRGGAGSLFWSEFGPRICV
jgi:hypothetical protein